MHTYYFIIENPVTMYIHVHVESATLVHVLAHHAQVMYIMFIIVPCTCKHSNYASLSCIDVQ